jgi:NitT/TauT family transport system substrate-binding protein
MRRVLSLLLLCLVLAFPGWADLKIGLMPACNSIPLVVADRKGLFAAEGLRVELVPFSSQLNRETALQTGAIDGTVSDLINAIQSWARGFGARVTSATEGSFSLLSSPQSTMRTMADWKVGEGVKVRTGLLENSIVYYVTERMLQSQGADPSRIELVPILQLPARVEMLLAGKIDAACLPEPLATAAVARGAHRLSDTDAMGSTPGVLLFAARTLAGKQREIAAFYRAYDNAVSEVNSNPEAYRGVIVTGCEFPPAVTGIMKIPRFRRSFLPSKAQVQDVALWMREKGLVPNVPRYDDVVLGGFASSDARHP